MKTITFIFLITLNLSVSIGACTAADVPTNPTDSLQSAVNDLYQSRFDASRQTLSDYSANHPRDPLPYAMKAASYLFAELE